MKPKSFIDDIPVFSTSQIADYGEPEDYGYEKFYVTESPVYVSDYKMETEMNIKKIHRYDRFARFKVTLLNLIGERGNIPSQVLTVVKTYFIAGDNLWEECRCVLKHFGLRKYYDNIPMILNILGHGRCFDKISNSDYLAILNDYHSLVTKFESLKTKRKYFPNIRYIVLKLLELHGYTPKFQIPFVRTSRKLKTLEELWDDLK